MAKNFNIYVDKENMGTTFLNNVEPGTACVAKFNYVAEREGDLSVKQGDPLTFVKSTTVRGWCILRNSDGECGEVPLNFIEKANESKSMTGTMPWFHGDISRLRAEELLTASEDATFLIRQSTTHPYSLSVNYGTKVGHYRIICQGDRVTIDGLSTFKTLSQLVQYYQEAAHGLVRKLGRPLVKKVTAAAAAKDIYPQLSITAPPSRMSGWVIDVKDLDIRDIIGNGEASVVHEARYRGEKVAVKSAKKDPKSLLAEAALMASLKHPNLLQLVGVALPGPLDTYPSYMVVEFMDNGALLEYLRSRGRQLVTRSDLMGFAKDISSGMEYLEKREITHRDLAARNILVTCDRMAKVGDFGMAGSVDLRSQMGTFPVKWTAPEALKHWIYSSPKSDVWSFGVLLWEMWSFGRVPYPKVLVKDLMAKLLAGYRMSAPDDCPRPVVEVMKSCWNIEPGSRPSFEEISVELAGIELD